MQKKIGSDAGPTGIRREWDMPSDHVMPLGEWILWRIAIFGPVLAVPAYLMATSPFGLVDTVRHYASAAGCSVGGLIGTMPAKKGEPGYFRRLDRNRTGIACEPEREARTLRGGNAGTFMRVEPETAQ